MQVRITRSDETSLLGQGKRPSRQQSFPSRDAISVSQGTLGGALKQDDGNRSSERVAGALMSHSAHEVMTMVTKGESGLVVCHQSPARTRSTGHHHASMGGRIAISPDIPRVVPTHGVLRSSGAACTNDQAHPAKHTLCGASSSHES